MLPLGGGGKQTGRGHDTLRQTVPPQRHPPLRTWADRRLRTEVPISPGNQAEAVLWDINPIRRPETTHSLAGPPEEALELK